MKRAKIILIWITGIMFIATGLLKLLHLDTMSIEMFNRANYPSWFFYLAGATELAAGILALPVSTRRYGFAMIAGVMAGAIGTHVYLNDNMGHAVVPALLILFSGLIIFKGE